MLDEVNKMYQANRSSAQVNAILLKLLFASECWTRDESERTSTAEWRCNNLLVEVRCKVVE